MATSLTLFKPILVVFILTTLLTHHAMADCESESSNSCNDKEKALALKVVAIFTILLSSVIGVSLPLVTRSVPALRPENDLFIIVKCFAAGIILGTGFMHVLPDSFDMLRSDCLDQKPWHEFPFSGLLAMFSAIITMMVDSLATSIYTSKFRTDIIPVGSSHQGGGDHEMDAVTFHGHHHLAQTKELHDTPSQQLLRYRVVAMVLELGIVVHSVVIGLGMGASNNKCTIKGLIAALCFHQLFEGMGLGGCILQAEYKFLKKAIMVFFFSVTTPFGIALGIALSTSYKENSPSALITVGLLNASSAGLLIYMALVDLLSADFMGPRLQGSVKLQLKSYIAVFLGAGGMSLMAKWA
ncbi:hypothetical protein Fmac_005956 [Flemingia macrophylla]|uniref:Uncharacterized protein n=1 Tax=Flemingia macrophylla TaxID=520843 RepID=A0ABD1N9S1_9FABA